ncbi:MAG TPA: tRNA pseudouridine(13) synthase TruD, partial [Thermus scotoductus]|nr:tRNA pseudouridine(13) synthase TruD [Thermus scotoductus]
MDLVYRPGRYPYLTQDLPGVGGVIRLLPQDFQVEEVPAYLPS